MTARELEQMIGRTGLLTVAEHTGSIRVPIVIIDAKQAYGRTRYLIRPHSERERMGSCWVDARRIELD